MVDESERPAHSPRGPSAAHRFVRCPGSINAERGLKDVPSIFSAEGTVFHDVVADCLEYGLEPHDFVGQQRVVDGFSIPVTLDMARHAEAGLSWVRERAEAGHLFVETRVDISPWCGPGEFGTSDVGIVAPDERLLIIFDWKYGAGVPVAPDWNEQLALYGLGFVNTFREQFPEMGMWPEEWRVLFVIEQPRAPGGGGQWELPLTALLDFGERIKAAAELSRRADAPRVAGEKQCKFCKRRKARAGCDAYNGMILDLFDMDEQAVDLIADLGATTLSLAHPADMTPARRAAVVQAMPLIADWLKKVHQHTFNDAVLGLPTPGLKLVEGRNSSRKYRDEAAAEAALVAILADDAFERKLRSPAGAERVLPKEQFRTFSAEHVVTGTPKPALVSVDDKRPAIKAAASCFDDEDLILES